MANISINDLVESKELDRDAMRSIIGGGSSAAILKPANPMRSSLLQGLPEYNPFAWASFAIGTPSD